MSALGGCLDWWEKQQSENQEVLGPALLALGKILPLRGPHIPRGEKRALEVSSLRPSFLEDSLMEAAQGSSGWAEERACGGTARPRPGSTHGPETGPSQTLQTLSAPWTLAVHEHGGCHLGSHCIHHRLPGTANPQGAAPRSLIRCYPPLSCVHVPASMPSPGVPGFRTNYLFTRTSVSG